MLPGKRASIMTMADELDNLVQNVTAPDGSVFQVTVSPPGSLIGRGPIRALLDRRWRVSIEEIPFDGYVPDSGAKTIAQSLRRHYSEARANEAAARDRTRRLVAELAQGLWTPSRWAAAVKD